MDCDYLFPELNAPPPKLIDGDDVVTEGTMRSWATFSVDRLYRYLLGRIWDPDGALMVLGMLNPSKAGPLDNDPTVGRVIGFAKRDKFGGVIVWNAMALISTDPRLLAQHSDPVGPRNIDAICAAIRAPFLAQSVAAWGRPPSAKLRRYITRAEVTARSYRKLWRFGDATKEGWPRHPLYLRADTPIVQHTPMSGKGT